MVGVGVGDGVWEPGASDAGKGAAAMGDFGGMFGIFALPFLVPELAGDSDTSRTTGLGDCGLAFRDLGVPFKSARRFVTPAFFFFRASVTFWLYEPPATASSSSCRPSVYSCRASAFLDPSVSVPLLTSWSAAVASFKMATLFLKGSSGLPTASDFVGGALEVVGGGPDFFGVCPDFVGVVGGFPPARWVIGGGMIGRHTFCVPRGVELRVSDLRRSEKGTNRTVHLRPVSVSKGELI